jgi:hypothetical protein
MSDKVQWPGKALNSEADDLGPPARQLVDTLDLLKIPTPASGSSAAGVIESTTLQLTSEVKKLITYAGGAAAVVGAASSGWAALKDNNTLAVTLAGGVAVVLAACALALAQVMNGDVRGRAAVTTEQLRSRASVATAYIGGSADELARAKATSSAASASKGTASDAKDSGLAADLRTALALGKQVKITTVHKTAGALVNAHWSESSGLRLTLDSGDNISLSEIETFTTS